jgi:hypothetical protein
MSILFSALNYIPPEQTFAKQNSYALVSKAHSENLQKCPDYSKHKNALTGSDLTLDKFIDYLICFVYDKNIKYIRREVPASPFVGSDDFVPMEIITIPMESFTLVGSPQLVTLSGIGQYSVIYKLMQLLDVPERAWAAHALLSHMTGKHGVVFSQYPNPKTWWDKEGRTGKAKKEWDKKFFNKPGYDLYFKPGGNFFLQPQKN